MTPTLKPLVFLGSSQDDLRGFPPAVQHAFPKKTQKTRKEDIELAKKRYKQIGVRR
jgi:phage-related protein